MGSIPIIDLREKFNVFIITNGRSTFEYCHEAIKGQIGVLVNIHIVRDRKWVDANNYCLANCPSKYFLRVDDDMMLHPKALLFINMEIDVMMKQKRKKYVAMRFWKLWEPWRRQPVNGIKLYNRDIVKKKLRGFHSNKAGKIDAVFTEKVKRSKYLITANRSMIGVHSCSTAEENILYATMRGEQANKGFKKKCNRLIRDIGRYDRSIEYQYKFAIGRGLEKINRKFRTDFYGFTLKNLEE